MSKLAHAGASSTTPGRLRQRRRPSRRPPRATPRRAPATTSASASRTQRPRLANRHDRLRPALQRLAQQPQVAALEAAADDRHQSAIEALDRSQRRLDVGRLRVVHEPHAVDLGDELHRVLEAAERLDRGASSPPARRRQSRRPSPPPSRRPPGAGRAGESRRAAPAARSLPRAADRRSSRPRSTVPPRSTLGRARTAASRRAPRLRQLEHRRIVGVDHRPVVRPSWFSKIRALAAAYASTLGCRSRWSGEKFSITAIHG